MLILDTVEPTPMLSDLIVMSWVIVMTAAKRCWGLVQRKRMERVKERIRTSILNVLYVDRASTVDIARKLLHHTFLC